MRRTLIIRRILGNEDLWTHYHYHVTRTMGIVAVANHLTQPLRHGIARYFLKINNIFEIRILTQIVYQCLLHVIQLQSLGMYLVMVEIISA